MASMDPGLDRILRALDEAAEWVKSHRFELTPEYLALVERVEEMPGNQDGADKSGRWLGSRARSRRLAGRATLLPGRP